jgi:hypothetical protein
MKKNSLQTIKKTLDVLLLAEGFHPNKSAWLRPKNNFIDVIDLQTSKFTNEFTLNTGIYKSDFHEEIYGSLPKSIFAANCIIEKRAGALANNDLDYWWSFNSPDVGYEVQACVQNYVLPFLDAHHSLEAMIEFLEHKRAQKYTGFPQSYYLAILYCKANRKNDGCMLLRQLQAKAQKILGKSYNGESQPVTRLLQKYGCLLN